MPLLDITSIIRHTIRDFPISFTVTLKFRTVSTASPSPVPALAAAVPSFGLLIPITGKAGTKQLCVSSANHNVYTLCGGRFSSSSSATIDNHILMTVYFDVRISTDTREESLSPSPTSSPPSASEPTLKICSTTIARIDAEYALDKMYRKSARFGHDNNSSAGSRRNVEVRKSVCNLDNQEDSRRRLRYLQQKYNMFKQADNWLDFMFKLQ